MFAANKKSNLFLLETVIFYVIIARVTCDLIITLLAVVPVNFVVLSLSMLVLLSIIFIVIEQMSGFTFLPLPLFCLSISLLQMLCIAFDPTYLPVWLKIVAIVVCIITSLQVINGINAKKRWYYIYQFELIDAAKLLLIVWYIIITIDVLDSAGFNIAYSFFILPITVMIILSYNIDNKKIANRFFVPAYILSLILICIYDYIVYGKFYEHVAVSIALPIFFLLCKQLLKRKTVFLFTIMNASLAMIVYLGIFNFFPDIMNSAISIIGLVIDAGALFVLFVKIKQKTIRAMLSPFIGNYSHDDIKEQMSSYTENIIRENAFFGSATVKAVEFASDNNIIDKASIGVIRNEAELSDNIFITVTARRLPKSFDSLRHAYWFAKLHWRLFISALLLLIWLPVAIPGIHNVLSNFLAERGKISTVLESAYFANCYSIETIDELSSKKDITHYESFSQYIARVFKNKADEYQKNKRIDLQIQALSLSLRFDYSYYTLYQRLNAYCSINDYVDMMSDFDSLLAFEKHEDEKKDLVDEKSTISLYYGYYQAALDDARILSRDYPSTENDAWVGACMIGSGDARNALRILNSCIEKDKDLPYWVYRMRGIAYLVLAENGELNYIDNAKSDILAAYNGEKSSNNSLAYARLCLYLGNNAQANELIESVLQEEKDNGRAYFWLSRYYYSLHDYVNEFIALKKSRDLRYIGNGEY